jgi:hypothetical protein
MNEKGEKARDGSSNRNALFLFGPAWPSMYGTTPDFCTIPNC